MGLETVSSSTNKFVTIVNGLFTIRLPDNSDDPKAVERTLTKGPNAGKAVKELQFNRLSGKLQGSYIDKSDYGSSLIFNLVDGNETFKFQLPVESQFFSQIVKRLPNYNMDADEVEFNMGYDSERDKPFIYMRQDDVTVPMHFTKDNPNGMPQPVQKTIKGEKRWIWEEQENFLYDVAVEFVGKFDGSVGKEPQLEDDVPF
tara:strand:+ start:63 stop:665 length:603 start_codon:yes stop_codon:yes gene_type:complete